MSTGYQPAPTAPISTGATSIHLRTNRAPVVDGLLEAFEATFGGYVPADWTFDAECTRPGVDPEDFYPRKSGPQAEARAKKICAVCIVREKCLADAIAFETGQLGAGDVRPEVHGTRGGMTAKERRQHIQKLNVEAQERLRADVAKAYAEEPQTSVEDIAARFGVQKSSVARWAKAAGYPARPRHGGRKRQEVA